MPDINYKRAIVFIDLSSSTSMFEKIGDVVATDLVRTITGKIADHLTKRGGRVVKFLGDGVMAIFESPGSVVDACMDLDVVIKAVDVQAQLKGGSVAIRAGVDYGSIVEVDNDAYGDIVNVASRILSLAKPGELMMTVAVFDRLTPLMRQVCRRLGRVYLRGKTVPQLIYGLDLTLDETGESITQFGDETEISSTKRSGWNETSSSYITLNYEGTDYHFSAEQMPIVIGRSIECDLVVPDARVSRTHVRLDWIAGQFYLTDISINGTMVQYGGTVAGTPLPLSMRRQRCTLMRTGFIILGLLDRHAMEHSGGMPPLLRFQVVEKAQEELRL